MPWVSNHVAVFYPRGEFRFTDKEGSEDTQSEEGSKLRMLRMKVKLLHLEEKTAVRDSSVLARLRCEIPSRKHLKSSHYRG